MISYGRQSISPEDIDAVNDVLRGDFLTCGPTVAEFEKKFASYIGAKYAVAVANGTAALHLACLATGLKAGEELITTPMTFAASANCALYCGAKPIFVDVDEQGLIDISKIEEKITDKIRVIIPVDYTGLPCDMKKIQKLAKKHNLVIIEDSCHALGAKLDGEMVGSGKYADMCIFSFHPVKHITTGEGGMITTNSKDYYNKLIMLRNHGITKDKDNMQRKDEGGWYHEMQELGFNYRITDIQCALGLSQLSRVDGFIEKRRKIAKRYDEAFKGSKDIEPLLEKKGQFDSYHLYVILLKDAKTRRELYDYLAKNGINCQVHYIPVYYHPYYQKLGYKRGLCPEAEKFYERILSIPIYPDLSEKEQEFVIGKIKDFFKK